MYNPEEFTVYDIRACNALDAFYYIGDRATTTAKWKGYKEFLEAVLEATPSYLSPRDKDRWIWATNVSEQLIRGITNGLI